VGMSNMLVRAYGRNTPSAPLELISSTGRTDAAGRFELFVRSGRATVFDLRITPGPGKRAASLVRRNVQLTDPLLITPGAPATIAPVRYPALPASVRYQLPISGPDPAGGRRPAVGATTTFSATLVTGTLETVTYETTAVVNSRGVAEVELIPGTAAAGRPYRVSVVPTAAAQYGAIWDTQMTLGPPPPGAADVLLPEVELPRRVFVTGRVVEPDGTAAAMISVRPQLGRSFLSSLSPETLERIALVGLPEATTDASGIFTVYLDSQLVGLTPTFDFELVPPSASRLSRWSRDNVTMPASPDMKVNLQDVTLPRTTLATGTVRDEMGAPVPDAEVRVYMRSGHAVSRLRTLARSDLDGKVVLHLPSP
jgi:hypothetical protein